mmetsp:Transcript_7958/g.9038  ORF Transcript_7958/g.9038 Transcript_7958/m.9038 type:complete len:89 (+) Transcript_7958:38-304(+)
MTFNIHLYLRRLAHDFAGKYSALYKYPFLQYLANACKIMMINEYELIAWSYWLDGLELSEDEYTLEELIIFTALVVKVQLNDDQRLVE